MTIRTTLAALALTLPLASAPGLAGAGPTCRSFDTRAQSCAPGSTWDSSRGECVSQVTG